MTENFGALTVSLDSVGRARGALTGLTFVVKENIDVEAMCRAMANRPSRRAMRRRV